MLFISKAVLILAKNSLGQGQELFAKCIRGAQRNTSFGMSNMWHPILLPYIDAEGSVNLISL